MRRWIHNSCFFSSVNLTMSLTAQTRGQAANFEARGLKGHGRPDLSIWKAWTKDIDLSLVRWRHCLRGGLKKLRLGYLYEVNDDEMKTCPRYLSTRASFTLIALYLIALRFEGIILLPKLYKTARSLGLAEAPGSQSFLSKRSKMVWEKDIIEKGDMSEKYGERKTRE